MNAFLPSLRRSLSPDRPGAVAGALGVAAVGALLALATGINRSVLAEIDPAVGVHIVAALGALAIGAALLVGPKGRRLHRVLGWTWVALMATVAISSFLIRGLNGDAFSWIHLLSGWTLVALPMGVAFARRHKVAPHRQTMTGIYVGGLLVAGAFTFIPGRLMWRLFFG
jgi:uncharacterized membrane protein